MTLCDKLANGDKGGIGKFFWHVRTCPVNAFSNMVRITFPQRDTVFIVRLAKDFKIQMFQIRRNYLKKRLRSKRTRLNTCYFYDRITLMTEYEYIFFFLERDSKERTQDEKKETVETIPYVSCSRISNCIAYRENSNKRNKI